MQADKTETKSHGPKLRIVTAVLMTVAFLIAALLFICDARINASHEQMQEASNRYVSMTLAAKELEDSSDYLTDRVRCFTVTGDLQYLHDYFEEANTVRRRDSALEDLEALLAGSDSSAYSKLADALRLSNTLMEREYLAFRLMQASLGLNGSQLPDEVTSIVLSEADAILSPEAQKAKAESLVFNSVYMDFKNQIKNNVRLCTEDLIADTSEDLALSSARLRRLMTIQSVLIVALLLVVLGMVAFIVIEVRIPLSRMVRLMRDKQTIPPSGAEELRFVARTYNDIFNESLKQHQHLAYEATHDALTGVYNRSAYDMFIESADVDHIALLIVDVDDFKSVNDTYGHDGGDQVLKKVTSLLKHSFRSVDMICRIGGDEFAVIMTRANSSMSGLVVDKIARINAALQHPEDGTPPASISVGVAFADRKQPQGDLFKDADTALYYVKEAGRRGCKVYGEF